MMMPRAFLRAALLFACAAAASAAPSSGAAATRPVTPPLNGATRIGSRNVLLLMLGDSITFGCTGPTIEDCHGTSGGYRVPLALALSQAPLGNASNVGWNVTTMGTTATGPPYVPAQWLRHCGFPGWTIPRMLAFLPTAFASSPARPDIITIHLGTNDCARGYSNASIAANMDALLNATFAASPRSAVFLADTIATGQPFNACIDAWTPHVPLLVAKWAALGMNVTFVPMHAAVGICGAPGADADLCGSSQVHPSSAGYPRMASAFALAILRAMRA